MGMSREEAIKWLKDMKFEDDENCSENLALDMAIKALAQEPKEIYSKGYADGQRALLEHIELCKEEQEPKTGHWIEDAKTYYEELNKRGLGVDEYTPYFTDDIACSECLAKYSMLDNETQFFKYCPNCGAKMESEE